MSMRKKCLRDGHVFEGFIFPPYYVFCKRWFCAASAVGTPPTTAMAVSMHNAIPAENRWPPVELGHDAEIVRELRVRGEEDGQWGDMITRETPPDAQ